MFKDYMIAPRRAANSPVIFVELEKLNQKWRNDTSISNSRAKTRVNNKMGTFK
jgi:hypothetical protein